MINLEKQFTFKIKGIKFIPSIKNYGNDTYKVTYTNNNKSTSYPLLKPNSNSKELFLITKKTMKESILIDLIRGNL